MKHYAYTALISTALCASCAPVPVTEAKPQGSAKRKATPVIQREADQPSPVTLKLVTLEDPVEKAYTIGMPEGWANRTYSARVFDVHSMVDIAISPNGSVLIFAGDPSIPQYWSPHAATEMTRQFAKFNPKMRIEAFRPADTFFPAYVRRKYGKLPGFKITSTGADRELQQALQARFDEAGVNLKGTAARVAFSYTDGDKPMRGLILGQCADSGAFWIPTVQGVTTSGDPAKYLPMLEAMGKTRKMSPQWQAQQAQRHQEAMAQIQRFGQRMTEQHNRNMAWIQQSAQRHQQRAGPSRAGGRQHAGLQRPNGLHGFAAPGLSQLHQRREYGG